MKIQIFNGGNPDHFPSKRDEDFGFDLYSAVAGDDIEVILPLETKRIPTAVRSVLPEGVCGYIVERSSTGMKSMSIRAGVMDSGYRGYWNVQITNVGFRPLVITNNLNTKTIVDAVKARLKEAVANEGYPQFLVSDTSEVIIHEASKALAQFMILQECKKVELEEVDEQTIINTPSERGEGKEGSSGK